jgi:nucleoid-associated protein YgaU
VTVTRELKLALIVGFALVLVVTVLISDHLSRARSTELAGDVASEPVKIVEPPAVAVAEFTAPEPESPVTHAALPVIPVPMDTPASEPAQPIVEIQQGAPVRVAAADPLEREVASRGGSIRDGQIILPMTPAMQTEVRPLPPDSIPPVVTPPLPQASPDRVHVVASGDSVYKLCKQYYGDGKVWRKLATYNNLGDQPQLKIGDKLKIPAPETLLGRAPAAREPGPTLLARTPSNPTKPDAAAAVRTAKFTVKKGDTLGEIARRELGTTRRAGEILELNRGKIKDPNNVPLGAVLMIPAA